MVMENGQKENGYEVESCYQNRIEKNQQFQIPPTS